MTGPRIRLDPEACVGHGRCYALAPALFEPDELGHCVVVVEDPPPELLVAARTAVSSCPEDALSLTARPGSTPAPSDR